MYRVVKTIPLHCLVKKKPSPTGFKICKSLPLDDCCNRADDMDELKELCFQSPRSRFEPDDSSVVILEYAYAIKRKSIH